MLLTHSGRARVVVAVSALATPMLVSSTGAVAESASPQVRQSDSSQVVLTWERIAISTIYPLTPVPVGVPVLGFTSMAMYDAARTSLHRGASSETAAVATAAHDVLASYLPSAEAGLDAQLTTSLGTVSNAHARAKGVRIGERAAEEMLASRAGDGYGDMSIHYSKPAVAGFWQPEPPATDMLAPWLGSLRPLVLTSPVQVNGPDALTSADYTRDYNEVRRLGRATMSERTPEQTDTALFFNSNSATMVADAVLRKLEAHPLSLRTSALLFARMHAAMTDSVIRCWQLKRDVGFWRPSQAIAGAANDGNPLTVAEYGWAPLISNPPYSEYVSGHACLTAPAIATIRRMFGEGTDLELRWAGLTTAPTSTTRFYTNLSDIEHDAFNARIWSGLHFLDAMQDGYAVGHTTARRVAAVVR